MKTKEFRKSIRKGYHSMLPEPLPLPSVEITVLPKRQGFLLRCAGIIVFLGLCGLLRCSWGNPVYSPAAGKIKSEWIQMRLDETREILEKNTIGEV